VGFDLRIVPVRLAAAPTRRIRADAAAWEESSEHPPFGRLYRDEQPSAISLALTTEVPDADDHAPFAARTQQQAEYLLDPDRFKQHSSYDARERCMPYRIIFGDDVFAEHARSGQGLPWRCSTTAFLRQAAASIDSLDPVAARRRFSTQEMVALHAYRAAPGDDDEQFDELLQSLRDLSSYYRTVADRDLDVMVIEY
jgi:Domain of unknown function (DUF1877)